MLNSDICYNLFELKNIICGCVMRALLQRVLEAKVVVDGETTGEIEKGILVFLGLGKEDNLEKGKKLIDKILKYRFFDDLYTSKVDNRRISFSNNSWASSRVKTFFKSEAK